MITSRSLQVGTAAAVLLLSGLAVGACTVRNNARDAGGGGGGNTDAYIPLGTDGGFSIEGGSANPCEGDCGPVDLCGDGEGNGLDDDCDLIVDEGCTCRPGTTRDCFAGPPSRRNIGACSDGVMSCNEFAIWDRCGSGVFPANEVCDGVDNDCDGTADNGLSGCSSSVQCPSNETIAPLSNHTLDASRVTLTGSATPTSYTWTITCPDSVPAALCPALASPNARTTNAYFTASGAYRVSIAMSLSDGSTANCAWTVYVRGGEGSLRVELNWDTMTDSTGTDIDLHLHRWTRNGVDTNWFTGDDCYYANCQPDSSGAINWGYSNSDLDNCDDAPHGGGAEWRSLGYCRNPRLDVDTNGTDGSCRASETNPDLDAFCAPENINIDNPVIGQPYRIMVNYYSDSGNSRATNAWVNIYCGGAIRASYGRDAPLFQFESGDGNLGGGLFGGFGPGNASWLVADVVFFQGDCGLDCHVYPLGAAPSRNLGTNDSGFGPEEQSFGPAWSCDHDVAGRTCIER